MLGHSDDDPVVGSGWNQSLPPNDLWKVNIGLAALRTWAGLSTAAMAIAVGCTAGAPEVALSPGASEGRDLARSSGCVACHGRDGEGGIGPAWQGLAGSTVSFTDSTSTLADNEYLTTSISNPAAKLREGYTLKMPENNLNPEEVAKVVAYITELR